MRLRFAPSPTGYLHVGGARTALFNWLLARQAGGAFVLRVEDTDRDRSRPEHVDAILGGLSWLGIDWDEGPVFQADGLARHRRDAERLLDAGRAYRDFTAREDFERARDAAVAAGTGTVARLAREMAAGVSPEESRRRAEAGEPFAVRFLVPPGTTEWRDLVHGPTRFDNGEIDDFVILRSDGTPTYNLAVVSDDVAMAVTHVVRGDDHISNTPKQILLYEALGAPVPAFGHLPLILGPDGKRLSKRHGARAVEAFEAEGVLPDAMVNFLALLGWSPGTDEELLSRDDLIERFSLERVLKKGAVFDAAKLFWMNGQY
ncbi:MAG: glutamate--tRNA ligase, partial [Gemmatimonadetes bacterium]|nr:glutamate--tRNA ligase [Gemmatimonadota bacterium]